MIVAAAAVTVASAVFLVWECFHATDRPSTPVDVATEWATLMDRDAQMMRQSRQ